MKVYTYSEARQSLASVLEEAHKEGSVGIRRKDGRMFVIRPEPSNGSPPDIEGMNLGITTDGLLDSFEKAVVNNGDSARTAAPEDSQPGRIAKVLEKVDAHHERTLKKLAEYLEG